VRRVVVVVDQRIAVRVGEERHVAYTRVEDVALELHAALLEHRARRSDIVNP
jgi:hypothetical protein